VITDARYIHSPHDVQTERLERWLGRIGARRVEIERYVTNRPAGAEDRVRTSQTQDAVRQQVRNISPARRYPDENSAHAKPIKEVTMNSLLRIR
jgi:hypothetical protein